MLADETSGMPWLSSQEDRPATTIEQAVQWLADAIRAECDASMVLMEARNAHSASQDRLGKAKAVLNAVVERQVAHLNGGEIPSVRT